MNMQSTMERIVSFLLRMTASKKTLKIGEVKQITTRSPIGIRGRAEVTLKLEVETNTPYTHTSRYLLISVTRSASGLTFLFPCSASVESSDTALTATIMLKIMICTAPLTRAISLAFKPKILTK